MSEETPIIIGEVHKNTLQKIIVSIQEWKGKRFIDIRVYYLNMSDDEWYPTKKGIALSIEYYETVLDLIKKAGKELELEQIEVSS